MSEFFLDLYMSLNKMNMNGKDLDSILNNLPWKEIKTEDGKTIYICELKNEKK